MNCLYELDNKSAEERKLLMKSRKKNEELSRVKYDSNISVHAFGI